MRVDKDNTGQANPVYVDGEAIRISTTVQAGAKLAYSVFKEYGADGDLMTTREPHVGSL